MGFVLARFGHLVSVSLRVRVCLSTFNRARLQSHLSVLQSIESFDTCLRGSCLSIEFSVLRTLKGRYCGYSGGGILWCCCFFLQSSQFDFYYMGKVWEIFDGDGKTGWHCTIFLFGAAQKCIVVATSTCAVYMNCLKCSILYLMCDNISG